MRKSHEIGSFFEASEPGSDSGQLQRMPWERHGTAIYLETGRQALRSIVYDLRKRGVHTVFVPGYLCDSMLEPFHESSLAVQFLAMTPGLQIDLAGLSRLAQVAKGSGYAVLMARYFGHARDSAYMAELGRLRELGLLVLEDLTHAIFDETKSDADYSFASLRKLLPLATGAFVTGLNRPPALEYPPTTPPLGEDIWQSMDDKRLFIEGKIESRSFYDRFVAATEVLEERKAPRAMDERSRALLPNLPYQELAEKRTRNFSVLEKAVSSIQNLRVTNGVNLSIPTHLVLAESSPTTLRADLARHGIYCPVHWPRPRAVPSTLAWPAGYFSIPIDHRYDTDDMRYVATTLKELCR